MRYALDTVLAVVLFGMVTTCHAIRGGQSVTELGLQSAQTSLGHLSQRQLHQIEQLSNLIVSIQKPEKITSNIPQETLYAQTSYTHKCSGVLIENRLIITAAHCFDDQNTDIQIQSTQGTLKVRSIGIHKHYRREDLIDEYWQYVYDIKLENDHALIEVEENHDLTVLLRQLQLSTNLQHPPSSFTESVYVMGYGQTANIFGMGEGEGELRISGPLSASTQNHHRYEIKNNAKGACQGDSGGPMFKVFIDRVLLLATVSQGDCNTFSRYQAITPETLKPLNYQWLSRTTKTTEEIPSSPISPVALPLISK